MVLYKCVAFLINLEIFIPNREIGTFSGRRGAVGRRWGGLWGGGGRGEGVVDSGGYRPCVARGPVTSK